MLESCLRVYLLISTSAGGDAAKASLEVLRVFFFLSPLRVLAGASPRLILIEHIITR